MRSNTGRFTNPRGILPAAPSQVLQEAQGILGESFSRANAVNTLILATGTLYATAIGLWEGDMVSGIACSTTVAGAAQTGVWVGLYDRNLNLMSSSGDDKANFATAAGNKYTAITPVVIPRTDAYYLAILGVGGTQPTLARGAGTNTLGDAIPVVSTLQPALTMTGQAALPAVITPSIAVAVHFWLAAC